MSPSELERLAVARVDRDHADAVLQLPDAAHRAWGRPRGLYDRMNEIAFDKLTEFFRKSLG